jgi:hypothetical protein
MRGKLLHGGNDGTKVWTGDRKWNVDLDWDDRMGYFLNQVLSTILH